MEKKAMTAMYSTAHFFVDFACAFLMMRFAYAGQSVNILLYNFCAFALQMPIGIIEDKFGKGHRGAALGCALTAAAYPLAALGSLNTAAAVCAGVGNALFHVGGGVYVLDNYKSSGALGIFVSPGAIGLYLGTLWGNGTDVSPLLPFSLMCLWAGIIFAAPYIFGCEDKKGAPAQSALDFGLTGYKKAAAAMFFGVVIIRSFGGFALQMPWKIGAVLPLIAVIATAGGKALGGFFSDRFGRKTAAAASMLASAALYLFSENFAAGLVAILLFNMSMPITLRAAADIFNGGRGFSFGLLTFALFLGYAPFYAADSSELYISRAVMCGLCVISAGLLTAGFYLMGVKKENDNS